jgi:hypothetical protein
MLPSFDDSDWPTPWIQDLNGNCISSFNILYRGNQPISDVSNRAYWIWASDYNTTAAYNYVHCRLRLPASGNACFSSPCKNGGTCTNTKGGFTCSCAPGFSGTQCKNPVQSYQINVTVDDVLLKLYVDGVPYDVANSDVWHLKGTVNVDFLPSVIGIYGKVTVPPFGILASDSAGFVTDGTWKCTKNVYSDWMLTSFDDSAWPTALVEEMNGNRSSDLNRLYHSSLPIDQISNRAFWIWASNYNTTSQYNYVHCRLNIPPSGNACFSSPCKNGGTCSNNGASFTCTCAAGYSGPQCTRPTTDYQLNITAFNHLLDLYVDGVRYDVAKPDVVGLLQPVNTIKTEFPPKIIAVYAKNDGTLPGILASDSFGHKTDSSWKCTMYPYPNWMLVSFDDSAWPAAKTSSRNGDTTSEINFWHNWQKPLAGVSNDAFWIWSKDTNALQNYVYCRSPPLLYN